MVHLRRDLHGHYFILRVVDMLHPTYIYTLILWGISPMSGGLEFQGAWWCKGLDQPDNAPFNKWLHIESSECFRRYNGLSLFTALTIEKRNPQISSQRNENQLADQWALFSPSIPQQSISGSCYLLLTCCFLQNTALPKWPRIRCLHWCPGT